MKNLIFILFIIAISFINAQDDAVATVGDIKITKQEFLERYELSPVIGKENIRNEVGAKYSLLYSIIAEKLWALEAEKNKIDTLHSVTAPMDIIEKLYVKDALYKKEILDKITVTNEEINKALAKFLRKLKLRYIYTESEKDIKDKYYLLNSGYPFDSLYFSTVKEDNTKDIEFGMLDETVEDEVYKIPVGGFTPPILWNNGYYIFYLVSETRNLFVDTKGKNNTYDIIKKKLTDRKADILRKEYTAQLFKNVSAKSDKKLLDLVANNIFEIFKVKKASYDSNGAYYNLTPNEGILLELNLNDHLNNNFIKINNENIKLQKFIDDLIFFGIRFESKDLKTIAIKLNIKAKQFIEDELLAAEGYKQGLQYDPEVKRQVKMWKDNYLFNVYRSKFNLENTKFFTDSLNNKNSVINITNKNYNYLKINYKNLDETEDIFNNLYTKDNTELLNLYNQNNNIKIEIADQNSSQIEPELLEHLSTLKTNDIYGPITTKDGYNIIKLISVTKDTVKYTLTNSKEIEEYAQNLSGENIAKTTALWAKKYGVKINDELLKSLKVTRINSYIIRMFGFGGRIGAVPVTPPFYKWVEEYKKITNDNL